jgi:hypothetical protein
MSPARTALIDSPATEVADVPRDAETCGFLAAEAAEMRIDGSMAGVSKSSKSPESTEPNESRAGLKRGGGAG